MYEDNALGYRSSLALCLTKVRSSRACCPATLIRIHTPLLVLLLPLKKNVFAFSSPR